MVVSLAGSIVALVAAVAPGPAPQRLGVDRTTRSIWVQNAVHFTAFANLWWSVANLLPIRPLDGGNVVTELVGAAVPLAGCRWWRGRRGGLWALTHGQQYAGFFALLLAFQSYQEIAAEKGAPRR